MNQTKQNKIIPIVNSVINNNAKFEAKAPAHRHDTKNKLLITSE